MAKYDPLRAALEHARGPHVSMSFDRISAMLPGGLPASAYLHRAWWANQGDGRAGHAHAWMSAGFEVSQLSLSERTVTFSSRGSLPRLG